MRARFILPAVAGALALFGATPPTLAASVTMSGGVGSMDTYTPSSGGTVTSSGGGAGTIPWTMGFTAFGSGTFDPVPTGTGVLHTSGIPGVTYTSIAQSSNLTQGAAYTIDPSAIVSWASDGTQQMTSGTIQYIMIGGGGAATGDWSNAGSGSSYYGSGGGGSGLLKVGSFRYTGGTISVNIGQGGGQSTFNAMFYVTCSYSTSWSCTAPTGSQYSTQDGQSTTITYNGTTLTAAGGQAPRVPAIYQVWNSGWSVVGHGTGGSGGTSGSDGVYCGPSGASSCATGYGSSSSTSSGISLVPSGWSYVQTPSGTWQYVQNYASGSTATSVDEGQAGVNNYVTAYGVGGTSPTNQGLGYGKSNPIANPPFIAVPLPAINQMYCGVPAGISCSASTWDGYGGGGMSWFGAYYQTSTGLFGAGQPGMVAFRFFPDN